MSLQRMFTKLAIAFVAAKGMDAFRKQGGMKGLQDKMRQQQQAGGGGGIDGMLGRLGGAGGASSGGLGNILGSLGMAGATGGREAGATGQVSRQSGLGDVISQVGGAADGGSPQKVEGLLARTRQAEVDDEKAAGLAIRAMIQAARADGEIDSDEAAALHEVLGESEPSDQTFVDQALQEPVDADALAREVPKGAELEVYSGALMAITPNNRAEAEYLHALAQGLSLPQDQVNEIHAAMGKAPLY